MKEFKPKQQSFYAINSKMILYITIIKTLILILKANLTIIITIINFWRQFLYLQ